MHQLKNFYRAIRIMFGLVRYRNHPPRQVNLKRQTYPGLDQQDTPLIVFCPRTPSGQTIILYPGASNHGEEHPAMIVLGYALAGAGFTVYVPRIPPSKELILSALVIEWMIHFYKLLINSENIPTRKLSLMGVSFGGAMVLKILLDERIQTGPPKSVLVYGTYYDIESALQFLLTGKLNVAGKELHITPNEWGFIVLFHNYLSRVDVGYNTENVQKILNLRVHMLLDEVEAETRKLKGKERQLIDGILKAEATPEILRILDLFWRECKTDLEEASPKYWCHKIHDRVFIMHGANDSMSPYLESIKLAEVLPNNRLLISYLYEHREIATNKGLLFRLKEFFRIIMFLFEYIDYSESK